MAIFRKRERRKQLPPADQPGGDRLDRASAATPDGGETAEPAIDTTAVQSPFVLIDDAEIVQQAATIGTKAGNLARMRSAGIPVPPLAVVRPCALAEHLRAGGLWLDSLAGHSGQQREELRRALVDQPVPPEVTEAVVSAYAAICGAGTHSVAVRSSSGDEDGGGSSYAGQFESYLGVGDETALLTRLRQCWASAISDRVVNYSSTRDGGPSPFDRMAVIIQRQLFPDKAGVLFSRHPLRRTEDILYLESNFGTAESVVGGLSIPDSHVVSPGHGGGAGNAHRQQDGDDGRTIHRGWRTRDGNTTLSGRCAGHVGARNRWARSARHEDRATLRRPAGHRMGNRGR